MMKAALFLDRDGVINVDIGYAHLPEQIEFLPGIFELVKKANALDMLVVVVTNQAGIAKAYYDEAILLELMNWMRERFADQGARLDHVEFCPHHLQAVVDRYRIDCDCRKPKPGMLLNAAKLLNIDLKRSVMVGDNFKDMKAGFAAGCSTLFWITDDVNSPMQAQALNARCIKDPTQVELRTMQNVSNQP
jgi:D-glycero-D-manno-heptose 1,7-bisphosphate phosphatase